MASIRKKKLADSVIDEIKRMIETGELKEGDKLPNQNEFAARLGVSRTSLREALSTLTLIGVVEQRPGSGTVIRSRTSALFASDLAPPLLSDEKATRELIEARRYVELGAAELAAANATSAEIEGMEILTREMNLAYQENRIADYTEKDLAFHFSVAKAAHNRYVLHLFVGIRGIMEQYMRESFQFLPWMIEQSLSSHQKIFLAIQQKNPAKAVLEMRKHNAQMQTNLNHFYTKTSAKEERVNAN